MMTQKRIVKLLVLASFIGLQSSLQAMATTWSRKKTTYFTCAGSLYLSHALRLNRLVPTTRSLVQPLGSRSVHTYGFDTVFACDTGQVNNQLNHAFQNLEVDFVYHGQDHKNGTITDFQGQFAPWQIVRGGSNKLIRFNCPIEQGNLRLSGSFDGSTDLQGVTIEMELQLGWLGAGSAAAIGEGEKNKLVFNMGTEGSSSSDNPNSNSGSVAIVQITGGHIGNIAKGILHDNMPKIFLHNKDKINYVFAQMNLTPPGSNSWLAPKKWDYFYNQTTHSQQLCILSMLTDRELPSTPAFDDSVLSADSDANMIISQEMFLKHIIQPSLPAAYGHGATAGNFVYTTPWYGDPFITNSGELSCDSVSWSVFTFHPKITSLSIYIQDNQLVVAANGHCDLWPPLINAYMDFSCTTRNRAVFDTNRKTLYFENDPHPSKSYEKHIPWYDHAIPVEEIFDLIINYIVDVPSKVSGSTTSAMQSLTSDSTVNMVRWGNQDFNVSHAGLSGALYIQGKFNNTAIDSGPSHTVGPGGSAGTDVPLKKENEHHHTIPHVPGGGRLG